MAQAFSGIRIVDFTQVLAGPFATAQLALLGAEVIKIEMPGVGDQTRGLMSNSEDRQAGMSPSFLSCNLGKRSLTLDLKAPEAGEIVTRLVAASDVLIENFRGGVMQRLGFGYEAMREIKPDLVYCSISGYGQQGPKAGVPAYDGAIQADAGMMSITGHPDTGPTRTGYMPVDMATALNTAFAVSAALYRRQVTGEGQFIDVAMMDTAVVMQTIQIGNFLATGKTPPLLGNRSPTGHPTGNSFVTADGNINILALREKQVRGLFAVLDLAAALDDPRFATPSARMKHYDETFELLAGVIRTRASDTLLEQLAEAGVPAAAIRDFPEVVADEQFQHRRTFIEFPRPGAPEEMVKVVRAGFETDRDGPDTTLPPPGLGEHSTEILESIGFSGAEIEKFRTQGTI